MSEQILKDILGELKALNQRVGNLEDGQKELKSDVSDLNKGQLRLETRMENEVIEKIGALFDTREVTNDNFAKIMEKLDSIEIDTGYLVSRVARLEKLAK